MSFTNCMGDAGAFVPESAKHETVPLGCLFFPFSMMTHACYKNLFFLSKLHLAGRILKTWVFEALSNGCRRASVGGPGGVGS